MVKLSDTQIKDIENAWVSERSFSILAARSIFTIKPLFNIGKYKIVLAKKEEGIVL